MRIFPYSEGESYLMPDSIRGMLPTDNRAYTKAEGMISLWLHFNETTLPLSTSRLSRVWSWTVAEVENFLAEYTSLKTVQTEDNIDD